MTTIRNSIRWREIECAECPNKQFRVLAPMDKDRNPIKDPMYLQCINCNYMVGIMSTNKEDA